MFEKLLLASLLSFGAITKAQESVDERITRLEQEIKTLKQQRAEDKAAAGKDDKSETKQTRFELGKSGLKVSDADGDYSLRLRGYAHFDYRRFIDNDSDALVSEFLIRRARPIVEGELAGDFAYRIMYDFGGGQSRLFDAHVDYKPNKSFNLRLGKFKVPFGLERLKSSNDSNFVEIGLPSNLAPNRDIGMMAYGQLNPVFSYEFGVFNGVPDLGNTNSDEDSHKEFAVRLLAQPFKQAGFGLAATWGEKTGSTNVRQLGDYRTPAQARFFRYAADSFADGDHWRLAPQVYYYAGAFGLLAEYTVSSQEVRNGSRHRDLKNKAWETQFSYILTGEKKSHKGWPQINRPFNPANGAWGAWELAAKYAELTIDDQTFPLFASPDQSARTARNQGLSLHGYLNDNVKIIFDYEHTTFDGGSTAGSDRETEQVLLSRLVVKF